MDDLQLTERQKAKLRAVAERILSKMDELTEDDVKRWLREHDVIDATGMEIEHAETEKR